MRCPRCNAALSAAGVCAACLAAGGDEPVKLGALELEEPIGEGGMGLVYRARHTRLGRSVAVKLLPPELAENEEFRRRFEREAQALARLSHPGIVTIHDFGEEDGQYYIVMELAEGGTLSARMPMPADAAVGHAIALAEALAYAHGHGIVHRDIKPQNVLLSSDGRAKLTDFGVARFIGPHSGGWTVTQPDRVAGTPSYLAPEVVEGAGPDPRQDLYALGVLLYEMITGNRPVGDFAPLEGALDAIVRKLLAPDPERRYQTAGELVDALRALAPPPATSPAELNEDETIWEQAVAVVLTVCTACVLWAGYLCVTPKVIAAGDVMPLVMLDVTKLPDGRVISWARFEIGPLIAAVAALGVGLVAERLLERHWRHAGLIRAAPDGAVPGAGLVCGLGAFAMAGFALHMAMELATPFHLLRYVPIAGGLLEVVIVYFTWCVLLEARRRRRPWLSLHPLWMGVAMALVPPVSDLARYLSTWKP